MSILSDRQIRRLCETPEYWVHTDDRTLRQPIHAPYSQAETSMIWRLDGHQLNNPQFVARESQYVTEYREGEGFEPMISPFIDHQVKVVPGTGASIVSYGLSSYGYDVRLANKFKIFTNINSSVIDPLNMSDDCYVDFEGDVCVIPPNSYALGYTTEVFNIPRDVLTICVGKSTYARAGLVVNVTPIEPGFKGSVVLELANQTPLPMKVHANMGIAQFLFLRGTEACETSYGDRNGKYQNQRGVVTARV